MLVSNKETDTHILLIKLLRLLKVAFYSESVVVPFLEERFAIKKTLGQLALRAAVQVLVLSSLRRENLIIHTRMWYPTYRTNRKHIAMLHHPPIFSRLRPNIPGTDSSLILQ